MSLTTKILLYLVTSFSVATAQGLFSLYAKGIPTPFVASQWFYYSLSNLFLYGGITLYVAGFAFFIMLLHTFPVAQVTITLATIIMTIICAYNFILGQELSFTQYIGAFMTVLGLIALNSKW